MTSQIQFSENLIKGRIAEIIFEQMFRDEGRYTVLHFGYEYIVPELTRMGDKSEKTMEIIRRAPDFAVINQDTGAVRLIEVKYQSRYSYKYTLQDAKNMKKSWNPSYLFIATKAGFYFDDINRIIKNEGTSARLSDETISTAYQEKYLELLKKYEQ